MSPVNLEDEKWREEKEKREQMPFFKLPLFLEGVAEYILC